MNKTDLQNAVAEGIISSDQAQQLLAFANRTKEADNSMAAFDTEERDEPFRLFRGFRDVFIALGIIILGAGLTLYFGFASAGFSTRQNALFSVEQALLAALFVIFGFILGEVITRRLRLPFASLVLSLFVAGWSGLVGIPILGAIAQFATGELTEQVILPLFLLGAFLGSFAFYVFYKLPFVVLIMAGTLTAAAILMHRSDINFIFDQVTTKQLAAVSGFSILLGALWFDMRDRLRVKRFSECGFWLHLLAAPLITHSVLSDLSISRTDPILVIGVFLGLTFFALLIDRRAFLVSALVYLYFAFFQIIDQFGANSGLSFMATLIAIGSLVMLIGIGWAPLRRVLFTIVPDGLAAKVPPVAAIEQQQKEVSAT